MKLHYSQVMLNYAGNTCDLVIGLRHLQKQHCKFYQIKNLLMSFRSSITFLLVNSHPVFP